MINDILQMLVHFTESLVGVSYLVTALSYLTGVFCALRGVFMLKRIGDGRLMMQPMELSAPLMLIFIGGALIWWPALLDVATFTLWGTTNPISYIPTGGEEIETIMEVGIQIAKLVGIISFLKGWYYIAKSGEQGAQQGMVTKGITHMVGGIMAYHMGPTIQVLMNTFGY